jgi:hypothetical protein
MLLLSILLMGSQFVNAQDETPLTDEQRALLATINGAVDRMTPLTSYRFNQNWTGTNQLIFGGSGGTATTQVSFFCGVLAQFDSAGNLELAGGDYSSDYSLETSFDPPKTLSTISDLVVANNSLYQRFNSLSPQVPQWFVLSYDEFLAIYDLQYGVEAFDLFQLMPPMTFQSERLEPLGLRIAPLDESEVLSVVELEGETLDGQPMRVFEASLDPYPYLSDRLPGDPARLRDFFDRKTRAAFQLIMREQVQVQQRLWIGAQDGLPHRILETVQGNYDLAEVKQAIPGLPGSPADWSDAWDFSWTDDTSYGDFNVPVAVEIPADAVPLVTQFPHDLLWPDD